MTGMSFWIWIVFWFTSSIAVFGLIDLEIALKNCTSNPLQSTYFPPSYFQNASMNINVSVGIESLLNVDDLNYQIVMTMYLRVYWYDHRLVLPTATWENMNPANLVEGLELTPFIRASDQPLKVWLPDIQILEAIDVSTIVELIHLFPDGHLFWSRNLVVTMTQPTMDLHRYPNDIQEFSVSLQSFAYSSDFIRLVQLDNKFVNLISNANNIPMVSLNSLWKLQTKHPNGNEINADVPIFFNDHRQYHTVTTKFRFIRESYGVIFRLVIPIVIFMIIVGYTFWADIDKRIDITINMLLVVAAMYLIVGQIIPFTGYYTTIDLYITNAFVLLSFTILIHFLVFRLSRNAITHPMIGFLRNFIVYLCRIFAVPISAFALYYYFNIEDLFVVTPIIVLCALPVCYGLILWKNNVVEDFWKKYDEAKNRQISDEEDELKSTPGDDTISSAIENWMINFIGHYIEPYFRGKAKEGAALTSEEVEKHSRRQVAGQTLSAPGYQSTPHYFQRSKSTAIFSFDTEEDNNNGGIMLHPAHRQAPQPIYPDYAPHQKRNSSSIHQIYSHGSGKVVPYGHDDDGQLYEKVV